MKKGIAGFKEDLLTINSKVDNDLEPAVYNTCCPSRFQRLATPEAANFFEKVAVANLNTSMLKHYRHIP